MKLPIYLVSVRYMITKHRTSITSKRRLIIHSPVKDEFYKNKFTKEQIDKRLAPSIQGKNVKAPKFKVLNVELISEHGETTDRFSPEDVCPLFSN